MSSRVNYCADSVIMTISDKKETVVNTQPPKSTKTKPKKSGVTSTVDPKKTEQKQQQKTEPKPENHPKPSPKDKKDQKTEKTNKSELVRADGSLRSEVKVKPGYVPQEEVPKYTIPPKRDSAQKNKSIKPKITENEPEKKELTKKTEKSTDLTNTKIKSNKPAQAQIKKDTATVDKDEQIRQFKKEKRKRLQEQKKKATIDAQPETVTHAQKKPVVKKVVTKPQVTASGKRVLSGDELKKVRILRNMRRRLAEIRKIAAKFERGEKLYEDQIRKLEKKDVYLKRYNIAKVYA